MIEELYECILHITFFIDIPVIKTAEQTFVSMSINGYMFALLVFLFVSVHVRLLQSKYEVGDDESNMKTDIKAYKGYLC